jgi:hypothetical protein
MIWRENGTSVLAESCFSFVIYSNYRPGSVGIAARLRAGLPEESHISRWGGKRFLRSPQHPDRLWGLWGRFPRGGKWLRREADHSPPSSSQVKNMCRHNFHRACASMVWCLMKKRDSITNILFTLSPKTVPSICLIILFSLLYILFCLSRITPYSLLRFGVNPESVNHLDFCWESLDGRLAPPLYLYLA